MKILVCVRSVPLPESSFKVNARGDFYDETGLNFQVSEFDLFGVEEAVRIREKFQEVEITIVSVGPKTAADQIKKAMALGADSGVRIDLADANQKDALFTAGLIAAWAGDKNFDLIFCGVMSEDLQRAAVGPMLAELLKIPCATTVVSLTIDQDRTRLVCERELEGGERERVELPLPCLLTIQSGINLPRYASLSNVLRVKQMEIPAVPAESLGKIKSCERITRAYLPLPSAACEFLQGDAVKVADRLMERIRGKIHWF